MGATRKAVKIQTSGNHHGFGKVILFGEHVVVHGAMAIVAGVSEFTNCQLRITAGVPGFRVVDNRPAVPGYKKEKAAEQRKAHELVMHHLSVDLSVDGLEIVLGGPLVPSSGIGASASDVVALSRALNEMYDLKLTEDEINHSAFVGEGGYHGTPSGVDNTAATFGGLLTYRRAGGVAAFSALPLAAPLYLVVVSTGITASTTKVVGDVRRLKDEKPDWFDGVMRAYDAIVIAATKAIASGDMKALGALMDTNHRLCRDLTISCDELEDIVSSAKRLGAIGAKMSGTGRGGIAVALAVSKEAQDALAEGLKKECKSARFVWKYSVAPQTGKQAKL
jgi:mevalonate kinase